MFRLRHAKTPSVNCCRAVNLKSEVPCSKLSNKICRAGLHAQSFVHARYVMQREKILSIMWLDHAVFKYSLPALVPFFVVSWYFHSS